MFVITRSPIFARVLKNSGYLFSATGITAGLGLIQGILTARLLGVSDFGVLGAVTLFTSVINNLLSFRMSELVIRYVGQFSEDSDHARAAAIFKLAALVEIGASLAAFSLLAALAPLGARLLAKDPARADLFVLYGLVVLANLIAESSTGLLQIFDRFRRMAVLNLVGGVVTLIGVAAAYVLDAGLPGVLIAYLVGKSVGSVALSAAAVVEAGRRWGAGWARTPLALLRPRLKELARFAFNTNLAASLSLVTKDSELLWVSWLRSPLEAGYYRLALSLTNLIQMPLSPLPQTTYPELARQAARGDWTEMRHLLRRGTLLAGGYALLAGVFLLVAGKPLISLLYGADFLPAFPALMIVLVGLMIANAFYWRRPALLALGEPGFPTQVNLGLALLKLAGILLLVPRWGYLASAGLLAGFYLLGTILTVWKVLKLLPARSSPA